MVFRYLKHFMEFVIVQLLGMTRAIERWLEALGEKEIPIVERPVINGDEREQVEEANDREINEAPVIVEEIPAQVPPQEPRPNDVRQPVQVTLLCPLCNSTMEHSQSSGLGTEMDKGEFVYRCSNRPFL